MDILSFLKLAIDGIGSISFWIGIAGGAFGCYWIREKFFLGISKSDQFDFMDKVIIPHIRNLINNIEEKNIEKAIVNARMLSLRIIPYLKFCASKKERKDIKNILNEIKKAFTDNQENLIPLIEKLLDRLIT